MELGKKKNQAVLAFVLMLTMTALMVVMPVSAQIAEGSVLPTFLQLSVSPDPVGKGQTLWINAFMTKPTITAEFGGGGAVYTGIVVTMTKPDGSTEDFPAMTTDTTGGAWTSYVPDVVGDYTFQASYPGQHIDSSGYNFDYAADTSEMVTITVQEDPVEWIYNSPGLPEEYWTRPIYATNWAWDVLGGSWYGLGVPAFATTGGYDAQGNYQPYSEAPETAHIVWSKSTHFGGQPGGVIDATQSSNYMSTTIATQYFEPIILNGILYYTVLAGPNANATGWEALDIRTGEVLWSRSAGITGDQVMRMGEIVQYHSIQEFGSWAHIIGSASGGFFGTIDTYYVYDAYTGDYMATIEGVQSASFIVQTEGNSLGAILGYYASGGNLVLWNASRCLGGAGVGTDCTYRPSGTYNWSRGIEWTVPLPTECNGVPVSLSVAAVTNDDVILVRYSPTPGMFVSLSSGYQVCAGLNASTGELLWGPVNQTIPENEDVTLLCAGEGAYVLHNKDTNEAYGYSLTNGNYLWGPVVLKGNSWSTLQRAGDIAYGLCFVWDSGGWVNAINLTTGDIKWSYNRGSAGYDTPYGVYLLWYNNAIADGKIYLSEGAMYNPPLHPARTICLNATTDNPDGELLWSILSYTGRECPAIADGHMIFWNSFDSKIYSFGKGATATTASVQTDMISLDGTALVKGTVMDLSPGAEQEGVIERFPNGLPAVADESMKEWMEYVYMQQKCPEDLTGVTVKITAMDPNNNTRDLGTVTSDAYGSYVFEFEPEVEGMYQIIATFEGSNSYWRSSATTYVKVSSTAAAGVPSAEEIADVTVGKLPAYPEIPAYLTIDLVILILAAVGVVIGLVAYMALRKQK